MAMSEGCAQGCWDAKVLGSEDRFSYSATDSIGMLQTARDEAVHAFLAASLDGEPPAVCQMTFKH